MTKEKNKSVSPNDKTTKSENNSLESKKFVASRARQAKPHIYYD